MPRQVLRGKLQEWWDRPERLSRSVFERVSQAFSVLYHPSSAEGWIPQSALLLLKLCEGAKGFADPIFTQPLAECEFTSYHIDTSTQWSQGSMAPLFATQSSQNSSQMEGDSQQGGAGAVKSTQGFVVSSGAKVCPRQPQT